MPRLSESINNFFTENFDCKIAFRTKNLSGILIENNTDKSDNKYGVCKLGCTDCLMIYLWTERQVLQRKNKRTWEIRGQEHYPLRMWWPLGILAIIFRFYIQKTEVSRREFLNDPSDANRSLNLFLYKELEFLTVSTCLQ